MTVQSEKYMNWKVKGKKNYGERERKRRRSDSEAVTRGSVTGGPGGEVEAGGWLDSRRKR